MIVLRWLLAACLGLVALFCLVAFAATILGASARVEKDRALLAVLERGARDVEAFRRIAGRLPTSAEYHDRYASRDTFPYIHLGCPVDTDVDLRPLRRDLQPGGYVLCFWRSEWFEGLAVPSRATTLMISRRKYLAGQALGLALFAGVAAASLFGAIRLSRPRPGL